jgi:hypothetical protein
VSYKRGLAVVFGSAIAAAVAFAATYPRFFAPPPATQGAGTHLGAPAVSPAPLAVEFPHLAIDTNPLSWANLTLAQRTALAPFADEWDRFSDERKRKWIKIASRFAKMTPEAQKRLQDRMAEWVRMTPEQRRVARENYQVSKAVPPQARQNAWRAYQQLPPEQKERLAALERKRRPTIVSAPPSGKKSEIRGLDKLVNAPGHPTGGAAAAGPGTGLHKATPEAPVQPPVPAPASATPAAPTPSESPDTSSIFRGAS